MWENNYFLKTLKQQAFLVDKFLNPYFIQISTTFNLYKPLLTFFLIAVFLVWVIFQFIKLVLVWKEKNKPISILEIIPPSSTQQSQLTTIRLFDSVYGLLKQRSWTMNFFDLYKSYAFEILSTKNDGIKYLLRVSKEDATIIRKTIISYLPGIEVKNASDYLETNIINYQVTDFKLTKHLAFPLKKQDSLKEYDPIAYITGSMTKLTEHELVAFQCIVSPVNGSINKAINKLRNLFLKNSDVLTMLSNPESLHSGYPFIFQLIVQVALLPVGLLVLIFTGGREGPFLPIAATARPRYESTYKDIIESQIKQKMDQPLFATSLRLLVLSKSTMTKAKVRKGFVAALAPFANGAYQSLKPKKYLKLQVVRNMLFWLYQHRLLTPFNKFVLSVTELSDLYHFPYTRTTKTENISKNFSKQLPAPLSLKQQKNKDIYFANNVYGGSRTPIGLTTDERRRHVYILGATGTGKTTMLLSMIKQDLEHGKGLAVLDPHGDLTEQILSTIPRNRLPDVVYFNPDDIGYPIGINLLELTPGLDPESALREKEFIAESIISVFHKIYTDKYSGPRMEYILRNTIHTAFTVPGATLFTIYKLLINTSFRKSVTRNITDENLKDFWRYEFAKAGDYQKVKMISPITNKIGRFLFSPTAKRILDQEKSTISFDSILNDGKILLANLSKGKIGEDNSNVFGVLLMAKIQLAALKRARIPEKKRRDFYLYVDEFQNFATPAFAQILSEARKYRLSAILAHQTTSQLEETSLVNVTLANTGTVICFRTANPEDERMILPQFRPYIDKGEIASLPSYHFYMRLGALHPEEPFSGITTPVKLSYSQNRVNEVIASSRNLYAKKWIEPKKNDIQAAPRIAKKTFKKQSKSFALLP
ncbi:ATP-binding protein [Candidatus Beckwithbacteria bacterium]|nr:ATP-binding protein [Candidatus Beckwithbacteria bacterium]